MLYLHVGPYIRVHSAMCMKMHCYFLLNIKHGASQFYWGRPPNTTMRPPGGGWRGLFRGLSEAPGGGVQLSSAGTWFCLQTPINVSNTEYRVLNII